MLVILAIFKYHVLLVLLVVWSMIVQIFMEHHWVIDICFGVFSIYSANMICTVLYLCITFLQGQNMSVYFPQAKFCIQWKWCICMYIQCVCVWLHCVGWSMATCVSKHIVFCNCLLHCTMISTLWLLLRCCTTMYICINSLWLYSVLINREQS